MDTKNIFPSFFESFGEVNARFYRPNESTENEVRLLYTFIGQLQAALTDMKTLQLLSYIIILFIKSYDL
jgi:hypothetical protein